jgi:ribosomal protein S27AE
MGPTREDRPLMTPNQAFRHVRKVYFICVALGIPLLFLALWAAATGSGFRIFALVLLIAGIAFLVGGTIVRASAVCPRCGSSLTWKAGPLGMGRISIAEKSHCPSCGLDLNVPWIPDADGHLHKGPDTHDHTPSPSQPDPHDRR